jgi:hypothetical protein
MQGFSFIAASTATSDASGNLRRYCPSLSSEETEGLTSCSLLLMMAVNRIAQVNLAILQTRSVQKLLTSLKSSFSSGLNSASQKVLIIYKELSSAASNLAATLCCKREFASSLGGGRYEVDPRFLLFEFCHNLLLRPAQVVLVKKLLVEVQNGNSVCHQVGYFILIKFVIENYITDDHGCWKNNSCWSSTCDAVGQFFYFDV